MEKCQVKSYPDYLFNEDSFINFENLKSTIENQKSLNADSKRYSRNIFKKENFIIPEDNIIPGFHLELKNSCKIPKHKYTNNFMSERNYLKPYYSISNERDINKLPNRNKINSFNKKNDKDINIDQTGEKVQRRGFNSFKKQLDVQKSVNFNILSFRRENYDSNLNKMHTFHKFDKGRTYFPINRMQTPLSSRHLTKKKEERLLSHKIPTLKFQSFYGCFNEEKPNKINNKAKSNSKIRNTHLEEYNLDKLIEIGDNYENKMIPILSFGKKVKNIKKKIKLKNSLIKNNSELIKKMQKLDSIRDIDNKIQNNIINGNQEKMKISYIKEIEIPNNGFIDNININHTENDKKILSAKKIVYHGQIKRKKKRKIINNAKIYINTKNSKMINMNNNINSINYKKYQNNKIQKNSKEVNLNKSCNSLLKFKKIIIKSNHIGFNQRYDKNGENQNQILQGITPKNYKRKKELNEINNSSINKIRNYNNLKNILERNKSLNDYTIINGNGNMENPEIIIKAKNPKEILLTKSEIMNFKCKGKKSNNFITNINSSVLQNRPNIKISDENYGKKYINKGNIININLNGINNSYKPKLYYGYNAYKVESNINSLPYLECIYSRKKRNIKNELIDNIN